MENHVTNDNLDREPHDSQTTSPEGERMTPPDEAKNDGVQADKADAIHASQGAEEGKVSAQEAQRLRKKAVKTIEEARKLLKRAQKTLAPERQKMVENAIQALQNDLDTPEASCANDLHALEDIIEKYLKFAKKSQTQEIFESLLIALAFALLLRTFLVEPFKIPTRSMVPTLLDGDQLFVTKLSYGIRLPFLDKYVVRFDAPQRGDVVVFAFPREDAAKYLARTHSKCLAAESLAGEKDYIKRIIGVPGDTIEVIDQVVHVNGEPIMQRPFYQRDVLDYLYFTDKREESWNREQHGTHHYTTITHTLQNQHFGPVKVQPDHVFVMGDNRDNSADSRCWGQVSIENIKGRAQIIWWSAGEWGLRTERMFTLID